MQLNIFNFIWFQTIWWLVILFQSSAIVVVIGLFALWLLLTPTRREDGLLMITIMAIGFCIDSLLTMSGIFIFSKAVVADSSMGQWFIPFWLVLLWGAFAATLTHSLASLRGSLPIAALAGGLFAPLSYIAGAKLGAVDLGYPVTTTYIVLCAIWAVILPVCFMLSARLSALIQPANT
ncbi:DUF2878 domain-containing protein [Alteromonas profundi]|nr:DUF2878 domain-containing protein [Alteromonas profundi]